MRAISVTQFFLVLVVLLNACSGPPAAAASHWSCKNVPSWVLGYSASTVSSTAANMGMTQWQIARLLKCLPKPRSYYG
jgi:ABC-type transport system involved in cytochrome c biogenesis permease subunit